MSLDRRIDGSEPLRRASAGSVEIRPADASGLLAVATMACPACDAPVSPGPGPMSIAEPVACPYCAHGAAVRDFLSLDVPARPARVEIRVVPRLRVPHAT